MDLCGDEFLPPNTEASQAVLTTNGGQVIPLWLWWHGGSQAVGTLRRGKAMGRSLLAWSETVPAVATRGCPVPSRKPAPLCSSGALPLMTHPLRGDFWFGLAGGLCWGPGCLEFADVAQEESTEVRENKQGQWKVKAGVGGTWVTMEGSGPPLPTLLGSWWEQG